MSSRLVIKAYAWGFGNIYYCGCISAKCNICPARSETSKYDAILKWNKQMKGETK